MAPLPDKTSGLDKPNEPSPYGEQIGDMFETGLSMNGQAVFADSDYTEDNKTYNRVKSYSFARETPISD
jgi:hypothetical protein